jgi:hypothetical protein
MPSAADWAASGQAGFFTCQEGACVTDGTLVRALIGLLPDGTYGIALEDQYGQTLLTPEGFGPSWAAYIASGMYNNAFQMGISCTYYLGSMQALFSACVGYYRLGEPSGTSAVDSSPTKNNGTYTGAPTLGVPGALYNDPNTAVTFAAASSQYVSIPSNAAYAFGANSAFNGGSYSLACWFNVSSVPVSNQFLISMGDATTNGFELVLTSSGTFVGAIGPAVVTSGPVPVDGQWHFVVLTMNRLFGEGNFYIDGQPSGTLNQDISAETQTITASTLYIGRLASGGSFFSGSIDEVAIFNSNLPNSTQDFVLSPAQVAWLYTVGTTASGKTALPIGTNFVNVSSISLPYWALTLTGSLGQATLVQDISYSSSSALLLESDPGTTSLPRIFSARVPVTPLLSYLLIVNMQYLAASGSTSALEASVIFYNEASVNIGNVSQSFNFTPNQFVGMAPYVVLQASSPPAATTAGIVLTFAGTSAGEFCVIGGVELSAVHSSYVPLGDQTITVVNTSTAGTIGVTATAELTALPFGVVAVQVRLACSSTIVNVGNYVAVQDYLGDTGASKACFNGAAAGIAAAAGYTVATGGKNSRQFRYSVGHAAGTVSYQIYVVGYYLG